MRSRLRRLTAFPLAALAALLLTPALSCAARVTTPVPAPVAEWLDSAEFRSLASDPKLVTSRIVTDAKTRERDLSLLPDWVKPNRVLDEKEVARARQRLQPILDYLNAGGLELFIFRDAVPFVALGEKSMLVVSTASLEFPDSELRAGVAHEIAHLQFFDAYLEAFMKQDGATIKRVELMCDALGDVWSTRSGEPAGSLLRAVKRVYQLEAKLGGQDPARAAMYPTIEEREAVMRRAQVVVAAYKPAEATK